MSARRVAVVGGGVVGLSVAHELARGGDAVTVLADRPLAATTSAVAAAVWFPYRTGSSPGAGRWLARAHARFAALAADPATGVDLRAGTVVERGPGADRSWTAAVPHHREATAAELPRGATGGVRATVPVVSIPQYLPWLEAQVQREGVRLVRRAVASPDELAGEADLVVVAAGLGSGPLLGDGALVPVRGQVAVLPNPGLTAWAIDEDDPAGMTYVVPRRTDVVCGGVAEVGSADPRVDPATERAVLERATALVPALAGLPVLASAVGLRPARPEVRLERVDGGAVPVVACYGHGGGGVTLSWGCAEAVAELAAQGAPGPPSAANRPSTEK